ncbi:MAG: hypothetical protein ACRDJC_01860 [Thermomicrobiales bacterium]
MQRNADVGRIGANVMAAAILIAPFIAVLVRIEAGLVVMAVALGATAVLLRVALPATPIATRHWLRLVIAINVALAVACAALATWLVLRG